MPYALMISSELILDDRVRLDDGGREMGGGRPSSTEGRDPLQLNCRHETRTKEGGGPTCRLATEGDEKMTIRRRCEAAT